MYRTSACPVASDVASDRAGRNDMDHGYRPTERSMSSSTSAFPVEEEIETGSAAPSVRERTLERALGNQIRNVRRQHDLSIADLASAAGISSGMLSKIENGGISAAP